MDYPTELNARRALLLAYVPPEAIEAAILAAHEDRSPVVQAVNVFNAMKGHVADLNAEGLTVLAAHAHYIVEGGFHGLAGEALAVRDAAILAFDSLGD